MKNSSQSEYNQDIQWRQFCVDVLSGRTVQSESLNLPAESSDEFLQFLFRQGLETVLLDLLEQADNTDLLPAEVVNSLIDIRRAAYIKEIYRKQHLIKLLNLLKNNQIECLILKGCAHAYDLYDHPYQRSRLDTDILIKTLDKEKTDRVLVNNGFIKSPTISGKLISHQNTYHLTDQNITHAYDIHWKISNLNAYADLFEFDGLYTNKMTLKKLNDNAFALDKVNTFLHSTVHYFGHRSHERDHLIWLYDLYLLAQGFSDQHWQYLLDSSNQKQLDPLVREILNICQDTLATQIPVFVNEQLKNSKIRLNEIEQKRLRVEHWSRVDQFKSDWASLNFRQRCQLLKEYLLPPSSFILKQNHSTNKLLLPYFYLKRIISGGIKVLANKN